MTRAALLCTDLDRTLIPNGNAPESPHAREQFHRLASHPDLTLAYVTGRHLALALQAIEDWGLPVPDYIIGDVGTSIYQSKAQNWQPWQQWLTEIASDWGHHSHADLRQLFSDLAALEMQEPEKQNLYKLSYYVAPTVDLAQLTREMRLRLEAEDVRASVIESLDETTNTGLIDVLPARATKRHAIEFLMTQSGFTHKNTVFAGDSGNDMPVFISPIQAVVVANASTAVKQNARTEAQLLRYDDAIFIASGKNTEMNGNYSAGILEGVAHYLPWTENWL